MALVEVKVPDIGDFKEVEIIELLVKVGDTVAAEQSLITVESDKASMEIPSSHAGVVKELKVKIGDKVAEGSLVLMLEVAATASPAATAAPAAAPAAAPVAAAPASAAAPVAPDVVASAGPVEVLVPDIGDFDQVTVIEVMVKAGDVLKVEQSLITVESDKASMEIPSSHAGVVKEVRVKVGDKVAKGTLVAIVEASAASAAAPATSVVTPSPAVAAVPVPAATGRVLPTAALPAHEPTAAKGTLPHASPSIRKLARELGVPLVEVKGSGPKSRITQDDVHGFVKSVMAGALQTQAQAAKAPAAAPGGSFPGLLAWPNVDFAKFGPVERKDLSRIKKISGANLHRNWVLIPHVTNHDDADITDLEAFRVQLNKENEKSVDATTGPSWPCSCWATNGTRGVSVGCSRFQRSASWPSRASSLKLGQLHTQAETPQSASSSFFASMLSRRMVPLPSRLTWAPLPPSFGASSSRYMPLRICSSVPGFRPGCG